MLVQTYQNIDEMFTLGVLAEAQAILVEWNLKAYERIVESCALEVSIVSGITFRCLPKYEFMKLHNIPPPLFIFQLTWGFVSMVFMPLNHIWNSHSQPSYFIKLKMQLLVQIYFDRISRKHSQILIIALYQYWITISLTLNNKQLIINFVYVNIVTSSCPS